MPKQPKKLRLTRRDLDLLRDAHSLGLLVPDLIAPYRFAGKGPSAVTSTLRRLYGRPPRFLYLRPEPLDENRVYYRLTPRGARVIGVSREATVRLGRQSLIRRYALAWLVCCQSPHDRVLLDRKALAKLLIEPGQIPKHGFYLQHCAGNPSRLGHAVVDHGAETKRLVRKVVRVTQRLINNRATRQFLLARRMTIAVLTFDEFKRKELETLLRRQLLRQLRTPLWKLGVDVRTELPFIVETYTVAGLLPLTAHDPRNH